VTHRLWRLPFIPDLVTLCIILVVVLLLSGAILDLIELKTYDLRFLSGAMCHLLPRSCWR
jgi:hypothetical protein